MGPICYGLERKLARDFFDTTSLWQKAILGQPFVFNVFIFQHLAVAKWQKKQLFKQQNFRQPPLQLVVLKSFLVLNRLNQTAR